MTWWIKEASNLCHMEQILYINYTHAYLNARSAIYHICWEKIQIKTFITLIKLEQSIQ
jgi:hypothetical protein